MVNVLFSALTAARDRFAGRTDETHHQRRHRLVEIKRSVAGGSASDGAVGRLRSHQRGMRPNAAAAARLASRATSKHAGEPAPAREPRRTIRAFLSPLRQQLECRRRLRRSFGRVVRGRNLDPAIARPSRIPARPGNTWSCRLRVVGEKAGEDELVVIGVGQVAAGPVDLGHAFADLVPRTAVGFGYLPLTALSFQPGFGIGFTSISPRECAPGPRSWRSRRSRAARAAPPCRTRRPAPAGFQRDMGEARCATRRQRRAAAPRRIVRNMDDLRDRGMNARGPQHGAACERRSHSGEARRRLRASGAHRARARWIEAARKRRRLADTAAVAPQHDRRSAMAGGAPAMQDTQQRCRGLAGSGAAHRSGSPPPGRGR